MTLIRVGETRLSPDDISLILTKNILKTNHEDSATIRAADILSVKISQHERFGAVLQNGVEEFHLARLFQPEFQARFVGVQANRRKGVRRPNSLLSV